MDRKSLKFKIPFIIMIFAIGCVFLTGLSFQYIATQNIKPNILDKNQIISNMVSDQIHIYLESAKSTVITAANFSSQSSGDLEEIQREIFRIYDNFPYFDLIFYMNNEAEMVFSKPSNEHVRGRAYKDRNYYWDIMEGKDVTVSHLLISSVLRESHFIIAAPVYNSQGEIIGLIGAGLPLKNIQRVVERTQTDFNGKIWVADSLGVLVIHPDITNVKDLMRIDNRQVYMKEGNTDFDKILSNKRKVIGSYEVDNVVKYGAITFVRDVDWMVVVEQPEETVFLEVNQLRRQLKLVVIGVILIALLLGFIIAYRITNPLEMLVSKVRELSYGLLGQEEVDLDQFQTDEIGELENAFHRMTIQLEGTFNELNQSYTRENRLQQYLKNILGSVANGIIVIDKDKNITIYNKEAENILEYPREAFLQKSIETFFQSIDVDLEPVIEDVLFNNKVVTDLEATAKSSTGQEMIISFTASCVLDKTKKIIGVVLLFKDLTRMKMIEKELRREDRIRTLGELSTSIIHDIGNPLAGISNLVEILKDSTYDDGSKKEILNILQEEIGDLNKLVLQFLDFSRTATLTKEKVDIISLIDNILYLLKFKAEDKPINIVKNYSNTPIYLKLDRRAMKQVFINIIKNGMEAIKEGGAITLTIQQKEQEVEVTIEDNGCGISASKLDKIFNPFYTTKKEGTGLGLSIVYKLIKEHDGHIDVESKEGVGTKMKVTLPID